MIDQKLNVAISLLTENMKYMTELFSFTNSGSMGRQKRKGNEPFKEIILNHSDIITEVLLNLCGNYMQPFSGTVF